MGPWVLIWSILSPGFVSTQLIPAQLLLLHPTSGCDCWEITEVWEENRSYCEHSDRVFYPLLPQLFIPGSFTKYSFTGFSYKVVIS